MGGRGLATACLLLALVVGMACKNTTLDLVDPKPFDASPIGGAGNDGARTDAAGGHGGGVGGAGSVCSGRPAIDAGAEANFSQGLLVYYPCDQVTGATLPDFSGSNNKATLATGSGSTGGTSFATVAGRGALVLNKASEGHAVLPAGLLAGACEMTVATWVFINSNAVWQRIWDFGTDDKVYMFLSTEGVPGLFLRFAISTNGNIEAGGSEQSVNGQAALPTGTWKHVAVVLGPNGALLYLDGVQVGAEPTVTLRPADLGSMPNNYIGRSNFAFDPYLDGAIDEFRVYDRALSPREIRTLASTW